MWRLRYLINQDAIIRVRTSAGTTEEAKTGDSVGQGIVDGAIISSASIDKDVNNAFVNSYRGGVLCRRKSAVLILYQDDIMRAADSIESLTMGNKVIEHVMEEKLLNLYTDNINLW